MKISRVVRQMLALGILAVVAPLPLNAIGNQSSAPIAAAAVVDPAPLDGAANPWISDDQVLSRITPTGPVPPPALANAAFAMTRGAADATSAVRPVVPTPVAAREVISGRIVDGETLQPLATAQVSLQGTGIGALSGQDGVFTLPDVPPGNYTLLAQRIGYQTVRQEVALAPGATARLELTMAPAVLALQGIVATGLIDPVEGVRSPITVSRVTRQMMPVTVAGSAVQNLQGVMPGVAITRLDGQPGGEVTMMLRTPTSVTQSGAPLIVVDGVILGTSSTSNIESMDIESIEVIKGASAASLYGSRAAAGVIAITTTRGRGLEVGRTQFSARSEIGRSQALQGDAVPTHHQYLINEAGTSYVDFDGNPVDRRNRVAPPPFEAFMDKPYPGPTFDNMKNLYQGGGFEAHNFAMQHNAVDTNFAITLNRYVEAGPLTNNGGYKRNSFRVNLDQRFRENISLGVSAFHSRDWRDDIDLSFNTLLRAPVDIDLSRKDENGEYLRIPDPAVAYENPLWRQASRQAETERVRTLAGANLNWEPYYWLGFTANVSYDRNDQASMEYVPKGTPLSVTEDDPSDGSLSHDTGLRDTWNSEIQMSLRNDFGPLNVRTTVRAVQEFDREQQSSASGTDFFVGGVPRLDATANRSSSSSQSEVKALGYLLDTAFDYDGKYILTLLGRRDGSSLFGPDNRWHNYYRIAGAYRIAEEPWFNVPYIDELKLSYAQGTAGGRPGFEAQYETWNATSSGISKGTLGNRNLRPEHTTEREVSLDLILAQKVGFKATYAWQETTDQLIEMAVPGVSGYAGQWTNLGTVTGNTLELSLESQLVQTPRANWSTMLMMDRSRSKISDWPAACITPNFQYWCDGVSMYAIFTSRYLESFEDLETHHGGLAKPHAGEFEINDDGFLVWVGEGNSFTEGVTKGLWGSSTTIEGLTYGWGLPMFDRAPDGSILRQEGGDGAHTNLGWVNNVIFGGLTLHAHLHAAIGGELLNQLTRSLLLTDQHPRMDQAGKPEELKKPVAYYHHIEGGRGTSFLIQSGEFLKLRTLSANYRFDGALLERAGLTRLGMSSFSFGLIGRNLLTLKKCDCPDPEQARNHTTRRGELATSAAYPNSRTLTAEFNVTF